MDKAEVEKSAGGVDLRQLVAALGSTVVAHTHEPASGASGTVSSVALLDADDVRFGVGRDTRTASVVLLVGMPAETAQRWFEQAAAAGALPVAVLAKSLPENIIQSLTARMVTVVLLDPRARAERIYNVIGRVLDDAVVGDTGRSGRVEDLFALSEEIARQTGALVSIEDERARLLAYSSADEHADELRRLSILGREGPPEMMARLRQWGVIDQIRRARGVVEVPAHPDLGVAARLAIPIRDSGTGALLGTLWLQQAGRDWPGDVSESLRGAAALAGRVISRRRRAGTAHDDLVRRLLGAFGDDIDVEHLAAEFHLDPDVAVVVVAFGMDAASSTPGSELPPEEISALTLHASALSELSLTVGLGSRAYVVLPMASGVADPAVTPWATTVVDAARRLFDLDVRAVVAGPDTGLRAASGLRRRADRVLDAAVREGGIIPAVTTVAASQTGVLLGEIVAHLAANPELIDARVRHLAERDAAGGSDLLGTLRAYLDRFGDVRCAAADLHIHPNTLRYRIRRIGELSGLDLDDPATRLVVALALRVM